MYLLSQKKYKEKKHGETTRLLQTKVIVIHISILSF